MKYAIRATAEFHTTDWFCVSEIQTKVLPTFWVEAASPEAVAVAKLIVAPFELQYEHIAVSVTVEVSME